MATDGLSELLSELRAGGEVDSHGRFTLDRAQARAKMQKFQLADARRYVLELVQAAVLRGATAIAFDIDADDMRMRCDGRPFSAAELDDLWGSIFADGDGPDLRGLRQLALGLNAALGMGPKRIVVRSGGHQLTLQPGRDDALAPIDPPVAGCTIHVRQRARLGLIVAFFRNLGGRLGEEVYLRERCRYAPLPITLDGASIVAGLRVAGVIAEAPVVAEGVQGVVGLLEQVKPAELRLVKDGVWIDSVPLEQCGWGFVAVVAGEQLRKDVSLAKIVADEGLGQIVGMVRAARWSVLARMVEAAERGALPREATLDRVRAEACTHLKLRDIRKRPDAAIVARALVWMDARNTGRPGEHRWVSIAEMADLIEATPAGEQATLRYASQGYPLLAAEGTPVPLLIEEFAKDLSRMLGCKREKIDDQLERASARERARRAWTKRTMEARLPEHRGYLIRAPIEAGGLRGELGLGVDGSRRDGTLWLLRDGCLLTRLEVQWGVAALDVVIEAGLTPADSYEDVVRDGALARAIVQVLAALAEPLARVIAAVRGGPGEGDVRGRIKAWLQLVLVAEERAGLWERLKIAGARAEEVSAGVLPTPAQVLAGTGPLAALLEVPLFEDVDGTRRSLRELAERRARVGALDELDRAEVAREPGLGREVLWLGRGDRQLLAHLFGAGALRSWKPVLEAMRNERAFRARPERTIAEIAGELAARSRGAGVDPAASCRTIAVDGIEAVIAPARVTGETAIELLYAGRTLTTRALDLGVPIVGAASSPALRPTPRWDDVVDDAGLRALHEVLRAAAWELVGGLVLRHAELGEGRDWLVARVLEREEAAARVPGLARLPLLATVDGGALSLAQLEAVIGEHTKIAWVPAETPRCEVGDPPIVREGSQVIEGLRRRLGADRVVEGGERLRLHGMRAQLEKLPAVERPALDPEKVWFVASLAGGTPRLEGEIGLSRGRGEGMALELCTGGRRIAVVVEADVPAPLEAILADPELPLTPLCAVDTRSKRYGHYMKRCRRAVPGLIVTLCERFPYLGADEREQARALLLGFAAHEGRIAERGQGRRRAWEAVRALPLLSDPWGRAYDLETIEKRASRGVVDVVSGPVEVDEGPPPRRLIVVVDAPARRALEAIVKLRDIGERWLEERAVLRGLAQAPEVALPDLREVAWIDRKATVSGGLEAHLWIPRRPGEGDALVFVRDRREVGRLALLAGVPCAGLVTGDGLVVGAGGVELDARQRSSLARQVCVLYEALAGQVKSGGRMNASERERAQAWLVRVDRALADEPLLTGLGKPYERLRAALGELVPPALRRAKGRKAGPPPAEVEPTPPRVEPTAKVEPPKVEPPTIVPAAPPVVAPTPEQRLLAVVRAELEWARARHGGLLERLGLDRLALGTDDRPGVARFDRGIVLHQRHPLVARQLARLAAGEEPDPIDLAFLVSTVYTLMNDVAEEIDATDEQAFVARMAESLALALA